MTLEALLAYVHLLAILTLVVFVASQAALCRVEWLNAAVVERLARLDRVVGVAALAVLATGIARTVWGMKGGAWYWGEPLLHLKLTLFVAAALLSIGPTRAFARWRRALHADGGLPPAEEIRRTRRQILIGAHLLAVIPLFAVFLARGGWA